VSRVSPARRQLKRGETREISVHPALDSAPSIDVARSINRSLRRCTLCALYSSRSSPAKRFARETDLRNGSQSLFFVRRGFAKSEISPSWRTRGGSHPYKAIGINRPLAFGAPRTSQMCIGRPLHVLDKHSDSGYRLVQIQTRGGRGASCATQHDAHVRAPRSRVIHDGRCG